MATIKEIATKAKVSISTVSRVLNFDDTLKGFNFYDIDFCLANYIDGKCKIGVTTNIRLAHKSVGELSDNWYENRDIIREKYGKYFPIKIAKNKK